MIRSRLIQLAVLLYFCMVSCEDPNGVRIRVRNASGQDFEEVLVVAGGQPVTNGVYYGSVAAGKVSEYRAFASSYSYAYVRVLAGGKEITFVPQDYVGESPLSPGTYTYVLGLTKSLPPQLTINCLKD